MGNGLKKTGEDIDECKFTDICKHGRCINKVGSFQCVCNAGYGVDPTGTLCVDIDECDIMKEICGPGNCVNTYGSFRCHCHDGYRNDAMLEKCVGKFYTLSNLYGSS